MGAGASWNLANVGAAAEPVATHYGVSLAAVGLFTTVLFAAELVSMVAIGPLVRRHGAKLVGVVALGLCAVGNLLTLAPLGVGAVLAVRFAVGAGVGLAFVGGTAYVQQLGGGPLAQGLYGGASLGTGGAAVAAVPGFVDPFGWRAPFLSAAVVAAGALAVAVVGPTVRSDAGEDGAGFLRLLGDRRLLRFAVVQTAAFGLGIVLSNWVVTLLTRRGGYGAETAGLIGALILVLGIVGRPAGGLFAHLRPDHTRALLVVAMLAGAAGSLLLGFAPPLAPALLGSLLIGLAAGAPFGPLVAALGRAFPGSPAAAFGAMNTYALLTIVLGAPLLGLSFDLPGNGLIGFAAAAAYWALAALLVPERALLDHSSGSAPGGRRAPLASVRPP